MNYIENLRKDLEEKNRLLREMAEAETDPLRRERLHGKADGIRIAMGDIYAFSRIYDGDL